jgi:hypothetical protein
MYIKKLVLGFELKEMLLVAVAVAGASCFLGLPVPVLALARPERARAQQPATSQAATQGARQVLLVVGTISCKLGTGSLSLHSVHSTPFESI